MPQMPLSDVLARARRIIRNTFMIGGTYYLYDTSFYVPNILFRVVKARHFYDMSVVKDQNKYIKDKYERVNVYNQDSP